nr:Stk1 family PASTA domain-containing Ser/Thr kinase [Clostridiales bacterium]
EMDNYVGKRIDGRYEIEQILGVGGMAVVYKAHDNIDDRTVAVKILKEEFLANEEFRRRFKNESKAIAVLSHPNIVKVYDVSFGENLQYIVMEYIDGITLKEYIEQQGIIDCKIAVHFVTQILRALQHAHDKGIVHRDVKPQNIMLLQDGTIKVTDFGIARFSRSETRTMTESAIGSVHYISPEQARGEITDEKADIYSVGVVLYEMLTGQLPFQSDNAVTVAIMQLQSDAIKPSKINDSIPLGLEQITLRAMQKNPRDRYQSAAEMLLDLDEFKRNPNIKFDYNYFVDQEPTKFIDKNVSAKAQPPVASTAPIVGVDAAMEDGEEVQDNVKTKTIPIVAGIAAGLAAVVVIILLILSFTGVIGGGEKIEVPNFINKNYETEIYNNEEYKDLTIEVKRQVNTDVASGTVFQQNPTAGTKVAKSRTITLYVATGDQNIEVPNVTGETIATAKQILMQKNLNVQEISVDTAKVEAGKVVSTSPAAGEMAEINATIIVYVSTGVNGGEYDVPEITSLKIEDAKQLLATYESGAFSIGNQTEVDSELPAGTIVSQEPKKGEKAYKGEKISITVSNGKKPSNNVSIPITLPSTGESGSLEVYLDSSLVYSDTVNLSGSAYNKITVSGTGNSSSVVVKINGVDIYTCNVNFTTGNISNSKTNSYMVKVPDVVGKTEEDAINALKAAHVTYRVETVNTGISGTVTKQSETGEVKGNVTVVIYVSK